MNAPGCSCSSLTDFVENHLTVNLRCFMMTHQGIRVMIDDPAVMVDKTSSSFHMSVGHMVLLLLLLGLDERIHAFISSQKTVCDNDSIPWKQPV